MQVNNDPANDRAENSSAQKKVCFFLCVYLILMMTTRYNTDTTDNRLTYLKQQLRTDGSTVSFTQIMSTIRTNQMYEGQWVQEPSTEQAQEEEKKVPFITESQGKFRMYLDNSAITYVDGVPKSGYHLELQILNGQYIDKGTLYYVFMLMKDDFFIEGEKNKVTMSLNTTEKPVQVSYREDQILLTLQEGKTNITSLNLTLSLLSTNELQTKFIIGNSKTVFSLNVTGTQNNFFQKLILVALMIFLSFSSFSSILATLKGIMELQDNPSRYSFLTVLLTNMWDTVLCLLCFILAFQDQLSLLFYIIPAFLYCLLFTNLQPRFLMMIYQSSMDNDANFRAALCKFNIFHYGSLIATYPIIMYTNFNWVLFILMSCIIFPQIYVNGFNNNRPDITSPYYTKYLFGRCILIFYLKCFPGNIFLLQPDYVLGTICLCLISIQYGLLVIQKLYGSKKVLPSFLLQPVYDYFLTEELNLEEGTDFPECSICLGALNIDPPKNQGELEFQPKQRLMKTPCNHNYHSHCLLVWMKIKMECPQCRFKLPPFE